MAVVQIDDIQEHIGASSDSKPTTGVPAGSTFEETDTGSFYIYTGSAWVIIDSQWVT